MAKWIDVGSEDDFPPDSHQCVTAEDIPVVVCRVDGHLEAFVNICPHAGLPIGQGELRAGVIICPFHGYAFSVKTGKNVDFPDDELPLRKYPIQQTDSGRIEVDIEDDAVS